EGAHRAGAVDGHAAGRGGHPDVPVRNRAVRNRAAERGVNRPQSSRHAPRDVPKLAPRERRPMGQPGHVTRSVTATLALVTVRDGYRRALTYRNRASFSLYIFTLSSSLSSSKILINRVMALTCSPRSWLYTWSTHRYDHMASRRCLLAR